MNRLIDPNTIAVFFGASPFGTALLLSLILTLVLMIVAKVGFYLAPKIRRLAKDYPEVHTWLQQRSQSVKEFQILVLSLSIIILGISAVVSLTQGVANVEAVADWDQKFVVAAHANIDWWEVSLFETTTAMAGRLASWIIGVTVALWLLATKKKRLLVLWTTGLIGNSIIVQVIKQTQARPRPSFLDPLLDEPNFSFPSGHASASILMYGLLAYIFLRSFQGLGRGKKFGLVLGVLWTGVFVGTSRLALGVHYPTDVLAGWMVAISWLTFLVTCDLVIKPSRQKV